MPPSALENPVVASQPLEKNLSSENLPEFPSKVLSNMFAVHPRLCDKKFELKINDVRFVGHPLSLEVKPGEAKNFARDIRSNITMFQVLQKISVQRELGCPIRGVFFRDPGFLVFKIQNPGKFHAVRSY